MSGAPDMVFFRFGAAGPERVMVVDGVARIAVLDPLVLLNLGRQAIAVAAEALTRGAGVPTAPTDSGWGIVRDAQRRVAAADGRAGIAVAHDIGDPLDIHPGEKHAVGQRLARVMRATVYGEPIGGSGPAIASAQASGGGVRLRFTGVTGALHARGSAQAIGFELCGAGPGTCRFATGTAAGDSVTLAGDGQRVTRVRYAWGDSAITNLTDDAALPIGTFEIPVS